VSPAAAADLERILYLARALQESPERSEIEQRAVAALERVASSSRLRDWQMRARARPTESCPRSRGRIASAQRSRSWRKNSVIVESALFSGTCAMSKCRYRPIAEKCRQLFRDSRRQSQRVTNDYAYLA